MFDRNEKSSCGVGLVARRGGEADHETLKQALAALSRLEHRGATCADQKSGDGSGVMTDIPFELLGHTRGKIALANLFLPRDPDTCERITDLIETTFSFLDLTIESWRDVPIDASHTGEAARAHLPVIRQAVILRPRFCRTVESFERLLYTAGKMTRTKISAAGIAKEYCFCSLSTTTVVYKAMTTAADLPLFYEDLRNPAFKTRFALFHRRFSTNTGSSWDKAQPFRLIAHNGEINTIAGNRSWTASREMTLGLPKGELLSLDGISDSGSLNEVAEALRFRGSIAAMEEILAIMIPPADGSNSFYKFWSRAMEPWDGPALVVYGDGRTVGARLDRNGLRPARWVETKDWFYLASEAGPFNIEESTILGKGSLAAGSGVRLDLTRDLIDFTDPGHPGMGGRAIFDPRLMTPKERRSMHEPLHLDRKPLFLYCREDMDRILVPMITTGKEPIGSMGDTARPILLSDQPRSFFDFFHQNFAQVTNPPLDYLREKNVTDLSTYLGGRPNIFAPKELIPPARAIELPSPVIGLGRMAWFERHLEAGEAPLTAEISTAFSRNTGMQARLEEIEAEALALSRNDVSVLILSDRHADMENPPLPCLIALRSVVNVLNRRGMRPRTSILVHTGEVRETHHVAALIGFGAAAVCPYLALEIARHENHSKLRTMAPEVKERNLIQALEGGLLKIMAKMGISVVRGYQSSKLFTPMGLDKTFTQTYFPGCTSPIGGLDLAGIEAAYLRHLDQSAGEKLPHTYQYKEQNKERMGEKHAMTAQRSRLIHQLVRQQDLSLESLELFSAYQDACDAGDPVNPRHLLAFKPAQSLSLDSVQSAAEITRTFGSGAMSFGAISAESQRDIFLAMAETGGRSNSGEGGENPYYFSDGTHASVKQIASGRFGVTGEYLAGGAEFQIKIAQGAKPGEGGQLMGVKVTEDIARARCASPGVDLISPPPMHDIYSIEDLKELIYELKQFRPEAAVSVKLVAGANIGTIAVGVAKAGADVIHISGGDGGTGAASLSSMKHAGLPWELGLAEVHRALTDEQLREHVILRVDGGLETAGDIVVAAALGAEEFDFGKLLLVAEGCVMARICEKNTCPTGIATHNPKFKAKYKGRKEHVVNLLTLLAESVRKRLADIGVASLQELLGRRDLLEPNPRHLEVIAARGIDLSLFLDQPTQIGDKRPALFSPKVNQLNQLIAADAWNRDTLGLETHLTYPISSTDRGIPATLAGLAAKRIYDHRMSTHRGLVPIESAGYGDKHLTFRGSAGQGFCAFLMSGLRVTLWGEANDSVGKSMSGGLCTIRPHREARFDAGVNTIIGNCALYGATGGRLYIHGQAGDRFAVRNSGATAVVEGAGLHACEYMTGGMVIFLGKASRNIGAGMTGGTLYLYDGRVEHINDEYLIRVHLTGRDEAELYEILTDYLKHTDSSQAQAILNDWENCKGRFSRFAPLNRVKSGLDSPVTPMWPERREGSHL